MLNSDVMKLVKIRIRRILTFKICRMRTRIEEFIYLLEIRSVERGICPIATSTMNELFSYNYGA